MNDRLIRQPTAVTPLVMSAVALAMIVGYVAVFGVTAPRGQDEGAAARLFQLLMVAQLPIIAWFGVRWLPREPRQALVILALQICAALVPIVTIIALEAGTTT